MRQHELRPDMNEGPKLGSGNHPVNVDFWVMLPKKDAPAARPWCRRAARQNQISGCFGQCI